MSNKLYVLCPGCSTTLQEAKHKHGGSAYASLKKMAAAGIECYNNSCPVYIEGVAEQLRKATLAYAHLDQRHDENLTTEHTQDPASDLNSQMAIEMSDEEMTDCDGEITDEDEEISDEDNSSSQGSDESTLDLSLLDPVLLAQVPHNTMTDDTSDDDDDDEDGSEDSSDVFYDTTNFPPIRPAPQAVPQAGPHAASFNALYAAFQAAAHAGTRGAPFQSARVQGAGPFQAVPPQALRLPFGPPQATHPPQTALPQAVHPRVTNLQPAYRQAVQPQAVRLQAAYPHAAYLQAAHFQAARPQAPVPGFTHTTAYGQATYSQFAYPPTARPHAPGHWQGPAARFHYSQAPIQAPPPPPPPPPPPHPPAAVQGSAKQAPSRPAPAAGQKPTRHHFEEWENETLLRMRYAGCSFAEIAMKLPRHTARSIESKWHSLTKGRPRRGAKKQQPRPQPQPQTQAQVAGNDVAADYSTQGQD